MAYPEPQGKHQFNRTNDAVDWASWTWNPVTGCLHGCKYCYAREIAYRFTDTYPIQFAPLFHHERLDAPINTKPGTGRAQDGRVFVCSMADLFGEWVPQNWIDAVLDATLKAPEWEYLFLTKFPQRYRRVNLPPKAWFGASVDIQKRVKITEKAMPELDVAVRWISVEPMLEPLVFNDLSWCDLVVIGAQSETKQPDGFVPAFAPPMEWVVDLIAQARAAGVPVYLKPNLLGELTGSKPGMKLPQEQPRRRNGTHDLRPLLFPPVSLHGHDHRRDAAKGQLRERLIPLCGHRARRRSSQPCPDHQRRTGRKIRYPRESDRCPSVNDRAGNHRGMRANYDGKSGPVNFKREMARKARIEREQARLLHPRRPGRPRKVGIRFGPERRRISELTPHTCQGCGKTFEPLRSDAKCCSPRCRKRVSRRKAQTQVNNGSSVTLTACTIGSGSGFPDQ